ncbi:polysaccharide lyase family 8 super-sandwich domain-containing protein [Streptomyces sp. NPDC058576]|uniref:polysaccharide lyase 8 family protein n=1 Tax=Streptomyces sp. NPDC058576 TaxID=3346547 RepID=UPI0036667541
MGAVFPYVTSGDGFYRDGSFVQHANYSYNGGYGKSLLYNVASLLSMLHTSPWQSPSPESGNVFAWVRNAFAPYTYFGAMMDMTRGRETARNFTSDHVAGHLLTAGMLQLATVAPASEARYLRELAKHWITRDEARDFFAFDPLQSQRVASLALARAVVRDSGVATGAESVGHVVSAGMARAVHRRPRFALGIAMASNIVKPYESINAENLKGWYTGWGTTYLYLPAKQAQFSNGYWPTINPYRLPGTTVDTRTLGTAQALTTTSVFAGGATVDGLGAIGMGLRPAGTTLSARKSWFCVGDRVVCLGTAITSTDGRTIETVVENRNTGQNGRTGLVVDSAATQSTPNGAPTVLKNPKWAHIDGVGGYVFPSGGTVKALREDRTGKWSDINRTYPDDTVYSRRYITLWFDHGTSPTNATYAYVLLPTASAAQTSAYAAAPDISVVSNTPAVQGVRHAAAGIAMVNVWEPGAPETAGITVDRKASVVTRVSKGELTVAVADASKAQTGTVRVTVDANAAAAVSTDPGVTVVSLSPAVVLSVAVDNSNGRTYTARFRLR